MVSILRGMLIFLLTVGLVSAETCLAKSPFLRHLTEVTLLPKASKPETNSCQAEWKEHLSCCEASSLIKYAATDSKEIARLAERVSEDFARFYAYQVSLNKTLIQIAALARADWKSWNQTNMEQETGLGKLIRELNQKHLRRATFNSYGFDDVVGEFRKANQKCWTKMAQIRNSSLCSICSGRASTFYSRSKAIITDKHCASLIDNCWISFKILNFYIRRVEVIKELTDTLVTNYSDMVTITNPKFLISEKVEEITRIVKRTSTRKHSTY